MDCFQATNVRQNAKVEELTAKDEEIINQLSAKDEELVAKDEEIIANLIELESDFYNFQVNVFHKSILNMILFTF